MSGPELNHTVKYSYLLSPCYYSRFVDGFPRAFEIINSKP